LWILILPLKVSLVLTATTQNSVAGNPIFYKTFLKYFVYLEKHFTQCLKPPKQFSRNASGNFRPSKTAKPNPKISANACGKNAHSSNHIKEMILSSMILLKASTSSRRSRAARRRVAPFAQRIPPTLPSVPIWEIRG
jgi:hypothetical protein